MRRHDCRYREVACRPRRRGPHHAARCAAGLLPVPKRQPARSGSLASGVDKALRGNMRERDRAAHAIGTLMEKALENPAWRDLLRAFKTELDALRRDRRASRLLLGQMKKHGHAHRGAAMQGYRRRRKVLDLASPAELAAWVNGHLQLAGRNRVTADHPGIQRLWRWMKHRVRFQPERRTSEAAGRPWGATMPAPGPCTISQRDATRASPAARAGTTPGGSTGPTHTTSMVNRQPVGGRMRGSRTRATGARPVGLTPRRGPLADVQVPVRCDPARAAVAAGRPCP